jgi:hypothetical protein
MGHMVDPYERLLDLLAGWAKYAEDTHPLDKDYVGGVCGLYQRAGKRDLKPAEVDRFVTSLVGPLVRGGRPIKVRVRGSYHR